MLQGGPRHPAGAVCESNTWAGWLPHHLHIGHVRASRHCINIAGTEVDLTHEAGSGGGGGGLKGRVALARFTLCTRKSRRGCSSAAIGAANIYYDSSCVQGCAFHLIRFGRRGRVDGESEGASTWGLPACFPGE
jgi:hypothetical protein